MDRSNELEQGVFNRGARPSIRMIVMPADANPYGDILGRDIVSMTGRKRRRLPAL
jgi:acyl-CoA hydrolase